MRIKQISVEGLFGIFNHTIPLNTSDRITIIHGPNGFGKTTLLKLTYALLSFRLSDLGVVPFLKFCVEFDEGSYIEVQNSTQKSRTNKEGKNQPFSQTIYYSKGGVERQSFSPKESEIQKELTRYIDRIPSLERFNRDIWIYTPTQEELSFDDVLEQFDDYLPNHPSSYSREIPDDFKKLIDSVSVRFIQTQRLQISNGRNSSSIYQKRIFERTSAAINRPTVVKYANELADNIKSKRDEFAKLSQALDRTFPNRLVKQSSSDYLSVEELSERLRQLEKKRSRLTDAGLIDKEEETDFQAPTQIESNRNVLSVYVRDNEQKLGIFDEIAGKIDLLKDIVKEHFLYKDMNVSKDKGFTFMSTNAERSTLSPSDLSSGEQHQLVMLYELLFEVKPNSLVLIDEPELSLHVVWQKQVLEDLQKIINLTQFDILMATHSPDIIGDRGDLLVGLEEPSK